MMFAMLLTALCGAAFAHQVPDIEPLSMQMIDYVNNHADATWKVGYAFLLDSYRYNFEHV